MFMKPERPTLRNFLFLIDTTPMIDNMKIWQNIEGKNLKIKLSTWVLIIISGVLLTTLSKG